MNRTCTLSTSILLIGIDFIRLLNQVMSTMNGNSKQSSVAVETSSESVAEKQQEAVDPAAAANQVPDGGWGWVVVFGCSVCHFFLLGFCRSLGIIFQQIQETFQATAADTGLVASLFVCCRSLGGENIHTMSNIKYNYDVGQQDHYHRTPIRSVSHTEVRSIYTI